MEECYDSESSWGLINFVMSRSGDVAVLSPPKIEFMLKHAVGWGEFVLSDIDTAFGLE